MLPDVRLPATRPAVMRDPAIPRRCAGPVSLAANALRRSAHMASAVVITSLIQGWVGWVCPMTQACSATHHRPLHIMLGDRCLHCCAVTKPAVLSDRTVSSLTQCGGHPPPPRIRPLAPPPTARTQHCWHLRHPLRRCGAGRRAFCAHLLRRRLSIRRSFIVCTCTCTLTGSR